MPEIENFIDENNIFAWNRKFYWWKQYIWSWQITDEDKKIIIDLIDKTNFSFDGKIYDVSMIQKLKLLRNRLRKKQSWKSRMKKSKGKKILEESIGPKNESHVEEEKFKNETRGETYLTRI